MTTISDPDVPTIIAEQLEPQLLDRARSRSRLAVVVGVGLTLFAVLNATAAVYLYRGINDLRTVEARLEELGAFEQRSVPGSTPSTTAFRAGSKSWTANCKAVSTKSTAT